MSKLGEFRILNQMRRVLSKFKDNKLALNHLFNLCNVSLMTLLNSIGFQLVIRTLVTSAKRTGIDDLFKNRVVIYKKKVPEEILEVHHD